MLARSEYVSDSVVGWPKPGSKQEACVQGLRLGLSFKEIIAVTGVDRSHLYHIEYRYKHGCWPDRKAIKVILKDASLLELVYAEAEKRSMTGPELLSKVIEVVVRDGLWRALLDD